MQSFFRSLRRCQNQTNTLLNTNSNQSRYFFFGLIAVSIFLFAFLHTLFNMMISREFVQPQSGYFDLYLENLSQCWEGLKYGGSGSGGQHPGRGGGGGGSVHIEDRWKVQLVSVTSEGGQHPNQTITTTTSSIRQPVRFLLDRHINSTTSTTGTTSISSYLNAGSCFFVNNNRHHDFRGHGKAVQCLPSFLIAGSMKAGTGELMKWLDFHPYLHYGRRRGKREMHYFTDEEVVNTFYPSTSPKPLMTMNHKTKHAMALDYVQHFPYFNEKEAQTIYTFEKSPDYIRSPWALQAIRSLLPSMKIILLLRNPIIRAISEFLHHCRHGRYIKVLKELKSKDGLFVWKQGRVLRIVSEEEEREFHRYYHYGIHAEDADNAAAGGGSGSGSDNSTSSFHPNRVDIKAMLAFAVRSRDLRGFSKTSYEMLHHSCTPLDAVAYFTKQSVDRPMNKNSLRKDRENFLQSNFTVWPRRGAGGQEMAMEILNGMYTAQLRSLLAM